MSLAKLRKAVRRALELSFVVAWLMTSAAAQQTTGTALIRHAPALNGDVRGSIQQMSAENTTFNSGASLGHLVRWTKPVALPPVAAPPQPTGTNRTGVLQAFNGDGAGGGTWFSTEKGPVPDAIGHATRTSRERWVNHRLILADDKICAAKALAGIYQPQSPVRTCPGGRGHPVVFKLFPHDKIPRWSAPLV